MRKLAVVVGHNAISKGAFSKHLKVSEFDFNSELALAIQRHAGNVDVQIFHRIDVGSYDAEQRAVYKKVDAFDPDLSIELHFNSVSDARAQGCETFSSGSRLSLIAAGALQDVLTQSLFPNDTTRDRGVKTRGHSERGGLSLHLGKAPALLLEPFFGSSPSDCKKVAAHGVDEIAKDILAGIHSAFKFFPREDLSESRTMGHSAKGQAATAGAGVVQAIDAAADGIVGGAESLPDAIREITVLTDLLPYAAPVVTTILVCLAFWHFSRVRMARQDDHAKGFR